MDDRLPAMPAESAILPGLCDRSTTNFYFHSTEDLLAGLLSHQFEDFNN
jgi:hypothetical protein